MNIDKIEHGLMVVDSIEYRYDLKIINNEVIPFWQRKNGHVLELDDIKELFDGSIKDKVDYVVIGGGMDNLMHVLDEVKDKIWKTFKTDCYIMDTKEAVDFFNDCIKEGENVIGLFHIFC